MLIGSCVGLGVAEGPTIRHTSRMSIRLVGSPLVCQWRTHMWMGYPFLLCPPYWAETAIAAYGDTRCTIRLRQGT